MKTAALLMLATSTLVAATWPCDRKSSHCSTYCPKEEVDYDWFVNRTGAYVKLMADSFSIDFKLHLELQKEFIDEDQYLKTAYPPSLGFKINSTRANAMDDYIMSLYTDPPTRLEIETFNPAVWKDGGNIIVTLEGRSDGITKSGIRQQWNGNYRAVFNLESRKIINMKVFFDSFSVLCYIGKIPVEICEEYNVAGRSTPAPTPVPAPVA